MTTVPAFALNATVKTKQNQPTATAAATSLANLSMDGGNSVESLCQEAARFRRLLEAQCDPIYCFQADFTLTFVNHAYSDLLGKAPTELLGHSLLAFIPPVYQPEVMADVATLTPANPVAITEWPLPLSDGTLRWFEWTHRLLLNEHGQGVEYQGVGRDITTRRQAEATARDQHRLSEALRTSLVALASTLSVEAVLQQILTSVATVMPSDAAAVILLDGEQARMIHEYGYTPESADYFKTYSFPHTVAQQIRALNKPYLIPDTQSSPHWVTLAFNARIRSSICVPIVLYEQTIGLLVLDSVTPNYFQPTDADNLQTFVHYVALALRNADHVRGLEEKVAARTADLQAANVQMEAALTEQKRAQRALVEERNLLRTIIDTIPDVIFAKDRNHRFILRNSTLGHSGDVDPQSCLGKTDFDYFPPVAAAAFHAEEEAIFRTGQPLFHQETLVPRTDDIAVWASVTKVPLRNQQGEMIGLVGISHDITQRKQHEQQQRFYASLQENVSDAVITTDLELRIQSWNRAAETIYGWRADEVMGQRVHELLQTTYEPSTSREEARQILFQQGFWQGEVRQRHCDGQWLYLLRSITLLKDAQGQPFGFVAVNRNITERKESERRLAEERNLLRTLIDAIPSTIYVKDRAHRFILRNAAPSHIIRDLDISTVIGKTDFDYHPAVIAEKFWAEEEALFQTGQPLLNQELQTVHTDGRVIWGTTTKVPLRNLHGEIIGLVGIAHDITDYKRALAALAASEEKYRHLIETMGSGLAIYDSNDNITYVNDRFCALLGYASAELLGTSAFDYVDDTNAQIITAQLACRRKGKNTAYELELIRKDGQRAHWLVTGSPLYNEQRQITGSFAVVTDIALQKKSAVALQEALKKQQELSELKSRFISMASHEFRTPLTSILLMIETLLIYRHRLTNEQIEQRLQGIQDQGRYLKTIIEDILELASIQAGRVKFEPLPLALDELCRKVLEELQPLTEASPRLLYQCDDPIPLANLDKRLMRYVVINLVTNGLKYSPALTPVVVRLTLQGAKLVLQVQDQGIGIPDADLPHLFKSFHRASNVGVIQGTGLGLVIVKEAVELHGGTITVTSQLGVGTTFVITLPIVDKGA